jgi:hypothetical protein
MLDLGTSRDKNLLVSSKLVILKYSGFSAIVVKENCG